MHLHQDSVKHYLISNNPVLQEGLVKEGRSLQLKRQPPNSPDLNILDFGLPSYNENYSIRFFLKILMT